MCKLIYHSDPVEEVVEGLLALISFSDTIEDLFEVDFHEHDNDTVEIISICFPGCTQNMMHDMSPAALESALASIQERYIDEAIEKVQRLIELRAMRGDNARDLQEGQAQRGPKL